jgi:rhamnogalacturonan hydrolase
VENIYCNLSGGCGMGSFGEDTDISDITYKNIYTWNSNQMMMIKGNGGSGTVSNVVLENFIGKQQALSFVIQTYRRADRGFKTAIGRGNAYSLDIDSYWSSMSAISGDGVELSNITIKNWKGTEANGAQRGPIKIICPDKVPCYNILIEDFAMWTETGSKQWYSCQSAYGSGLRISTPGTRTR